MLAHITHDFAARTGEERALQFWVGAVEALPGCAVARLDGRQSDSEG
jgi:hypothetical protein